MVHEECIMEARAGMGGQPILKTRLIRNEYARTGTTWDGCGFKLLLHTRFRVFSEALSRIILARISEKQTEVCLCGCLTV